MKTKTINLYEFHELTEEAQQKALENLWDINVSHEWWDFTYEDAKNVGVKITGFDLDRGQIDLELEGSCGETAEAIMREHGQDCGTYKKAKLFLDDMNAYLAQFPNIEDSDEELIEGKENEFIDDLRYEYRKILRNEYEYLTSKEAILETIEANEYTFTENGELEN